MYGAKCWFICSKHPDMVRGAMQIVSEAGYARLTPTEQAILRTKTVMFKSGECTTTDPMVAYACMNSNPDLGIHTVEKWKKEQPGGAVFTYVTPPTNDTDEPFVIEDEPKEPPVVAEPVAEQPEKQPEPGVVKTNVRGKTATTTRRRAPRKTK
jgi:hypothetical protein